MGRPSTWKTRRVARARGIPSTAAMPRRVMCTDRHASSVFVPGKLDQRAVDVAMLDSHDLSRPRAGIRHEHDERSHRPHDDDIGSYETVCMECHGRIHGGTHQGRI